MKRVIKALGLTALVLLSASEAMAQRTPSLSEARKLRDTANQTIGNGKVTDVRPMISDLQRALDKPDLPAEIEGKPVIFVDGAPERALFDAWQADPEGQNKTRNGKMPIAVDDPYPLIAHIVGLYLNETDHPDEALIALSKGFVILQEHHVVEAASTTAPLVIETAATLNATKQSAAALKTYDYALNLPAAEPLRPKVLRGKGYALIELGRLDEAEAVYNESLKLEPGNALALRELSYIASVRVGKPKNETPSLILTPNPNVPAQK